MFIVLEMMYEPIWSGAKINPEIEMSSLTMVWFQKSVNAMIYIIIYMSLHSMYNMYQRQIKKNI